MTRALYIKLGAGDCWAERALATGVLPLGYSAVSFELIQIALKNGFAAIQSFYQNNCGTGPGTATRFSNEVREFYSAGADVLWITFVNGSLWWCFAAVEVTEGPFEGINCSRYRQVQNGWSNQDLNGNPLLISALRGSLTTTAGYRGTICSVREFEYLARRIRGESTPEVAQVRSARTTLISKIAPLICGLHWKDFELLVELIMTQGGYRRVTETGGTQKTTDIELVLPLTGERLFVQVKARLDQNTVDGILPDLLRMADGGRIFIVYHSGPPEIKHVHPQVTIIGPASLAEHVVDLGLIKWIIGKTG
jgi:hypothetical protein